ncbi:MAG: hypothetical protein ACYC46_15910 [Acidobacteriaceae bacterium]
MLLAVFILFLLPAVGYSQQTTVNRYDIFTGYTNLDSPHIGLNESGFHLQTGVNMRSWYALGFDYSVSSGDLTLTPNLLPTALQQQLGAELAQLVAAGIIPATYQVRVPTHSFTQTFAAGPQFNYRHFQAVTFFVRPSIGAIRERATPHPTDAVTSGIAQQLAPAGYKLDWTGFYGFGGGMDYNATRHVGLRIQADFVHDHLFNDLLKDGRNTVRVSIGPFFHFGRNVAQ